jgi:hypothetical protein
LITELFSCTFPLPPAPESTILSVFPGTHILFVALSIYGDRKRMLRPLCGGKIYGEMPMETFLKFLESARAS